MSSDQRDHYLARVDAERAAASKSREANVAGLHEQIAKMYEEIVRDLDEEFPPPPAPAAK